MLPEILPSTMTLDGGLSNELENQGCDLNHLLWSAKVIESNPEKIIQAHYNYLEAGAQILITSSYQASIPGFKKLGYSPKKAEEIILKTVELAQEAIKRYSPVNTSDEKPLVAASIGPYAAFLADGSEYTGIYNVSIEEIKTFHIERLKILDKSNADFYACETIPNYQEAQVLSEILHEFNKQSWISFTCKDSIHINDGTPIVKCVELFKDHPNVFALGINCTAPQHISGLIKEIKKVDNKKHIVVYPNSGEFFDAKSKIWSGTSDPDSFVDLALDWKSKGANIIGGCCRIGPNHIKLLAHALEE